MLQSLFSPILYVVSAILWFWHEVFGYVLGPNNGFAWALSVFFLVFTLRALLLKPALSQIRAARKMQKFAPQMQKLREKYKGDRQRLAQEMQKLQSEQGVNPLGGCLPMLVQIPVFLSLTYLLRDFQPGAKSNFIFDRAGVQSFVDANLFGAKLSNWITQPTQVLAQYGTTRTDMMLVGIPLMLVASVATFFTMRLSQKRQTDVSMANPQSANVAKAMMYLAPVGALVAGWFLPLAVLLYWLANNVWTFGQSHFLSNKVDHEQELERQREIERKKAAPRPKPGQKPGAKRGGAAKEPGQPKGSADAKQDAGTKQDDGKDAAAKDEVPAEAAQESEASQGKQSVADTAANSESKAAENRANGHRPAGKPAQKPQQRSRPSKQAAGPRKSQKRRR